MEDIRDMVDAHGGFARKRELVRRGARDHHLTAAVRDGSVFRARNGWYSTFPIESPEFRAVRVGGRMTGESALRAVGAWLPPPGRPDVLHVAVPPNAARLRSQWRHRQRSKERADTGVVLHWEDRDGERRGSRTAVDLADAIVAYVLASTVEWAVAVLDWAATCGLIDRIDWERIILRLPRRLSSIGDWVDPSCESLMESLARTRLRMRGHQLASQVPVGASGRIDLVVDDVVAVELDGREFHESSFEKDRRKDLSITLEGRHAIRVSYTMLMHYWGWVQSAVDAALRARGHAPPPTGRRPRAGPDTPTKQIGRRGPSSLPLCV